MAAITYTNFRIERYELLGNEHVSFYIEAYQAGNKAFFTLIFDEYKRKMAAMHPELEQYFNGIRRSMSGYGPKEWEVLTVLEEEEFDFEGYFIEYLESDPAMVTAEIQRQLALYTNPIVQEKLSEKLAILDRHTTGDFINGNKFLDGLEKAVLAWLVDNYPEVAQGEPDDMDGLRHIMVNHIMPFGDELIKHIMGIRNRTNDE